MTAGLGRFTAAGHESQDFGPGISAEPDNIWASRDAGGWLRARRTRFAGAVLVDNFHLGIDVACATGTAALAPEAGIIRSIFWDEYRARCQVQEIRPGTVIFHGHLSRWISQPGQKVTRGQKTALTGCSGLCTGPHDHVMVYHSPVDTDWRNWFRWFAYNPDRLRVGGDLAGVPWIRPA
jgi:murein DD-endopeptidase MepM/ murein hydrolase activator NlpD